MGKLQEFLKRPRAEMDQGERLAYDFYSKAEQFRQEGMKQSIQQAVAILLEQRFGEQGNTFLATMRNSGKNMDWQDAFKHAMVDDLASLARRYGVKPI